MKRLLRMAVVVFACLGIAQADSPPNFVELSKRVIPSVVNIATTARVNVPQGGGNYRPGMPPGLEDLFRQFFDSYGGGGGRGMPPGGPGGEEEDGPPARGKGMQRPLSLGTGFIIDETGLILTNNHVIQGADEIKIQFTEDSDEQPTDGELIGRDPELDLALIRVKTKRPLKAISLGDSDKAEVGEYVLAVGNPFGQGHTVTHGILSAKGREAPKNLLARYLQTDAPINPGNSGGPLINMKGEVIGINNAIDARAQGIGFAIPINLVKRVLQQLKTKGSVARGYIGVQIDDLTPEIAEQLGMKKEMRAPYIAQVYPGEPAAKAGMELYDVVLEVNNKRVRSASELIEAITSVNVGETATIKVLRNGKERTLNVAVTERPNAQRFSQQGSRPQPGGRPQRGANLGMQIEDLTPELARDLNLQSNLKGPVVVNVQFQGPADRAGLMRGDLILEVDRKKVSNTEQFLASIGKTKSHLVRIQRHSLRGEPQFLVRVLDPRPQSEQ